MHASFNGSSGDGDFMPIQPINMRPTLAALAAQVSPSASCPTLCEAKPGDYFGEHDGKSDFDTAFWRAISLSRAGTRIKSADTTPCLKPYYFCFTALAQIASRRSYRMGPPLIAAHLSGVVSIFALPPAFVGLKRRRASRHQTRSGDFRRGRDHIADPL